MAARVGEETVKAPGELVITVYAFCTDVTLTVTPDLKSDGSVLLLIDTSGGKRRTGGTALAHVYGQLGNDPPDVDAPLVLVAAFNTLQALIRERLVLSGHDVSDGGILVALLEMAFAGDRGLSLELPVVAGDSGNELMASLFAEEVSIAIEVSPSNEAAVVDALEKAGVPWIKVGTSTAERRVRVMAGGELVLDVSMPDLRDTWEARSSPSPAALLPAERFRSP